MISHVQIDRMIELKEYRRLVERILDNGRSRSNMAKRVLSRPEAAGPAALGLSLQRLAELTYAPTATADRIARRLVVMQRRDGLFGYGSDTPYETLLAATAAAVRGLIDYAGHLRASGQPLNPSVNQALERGMDALANSFASLTNTTNGALGWAIVLWQLGDVQAFRQRVPVHQLLAMLNHAAVELIDDDLSRLATAMAA